MSNLLFCLTKVFACQNSAFVAQQEWNKQAYDEACNAPDFPPFDTAPEFEMAPERGWSMIRLIDLKTAVAFGERPTSNQ